MRTRIFSFLKNDDNYISGEEISRSLNISRSAVWKYIQDLRHEGYDIVAVPHLGYRLLHAPDRLLPQEVQDRLGTKVLGRQMLHYESVESTMGVAFQEAINGVQEGTVICAEHQSKGKGRQRRHWCSPRYKGIYASIILRPVLSPRDVPQLTLLTAVAVTEAIKEYAGLPCQIKWPNDIIFKGKKLCGILTEMSAETDRVRFIVIGIGINVNTPLNALPVRSTSIKQECGKTISRVELLRVILRCLEQWYALFKEKGFDPIGLKWKELSMTLGQRVSIQDFGGKVEGEAVDIDPYGALIIRQDNGLSVKRMSGDVTTLR